MRDLSLTLAHDLEISGLDLRLIDGAEQTRQQLLIKLKLWRGEWFLDTEFGTPYLQTILGKQLTLSGAVQAIRKSILEVDGVNSITNFAFDFNRQNRTLSVEFVVSTPYGLIEATA